MGTNITSSEINIVSPVVLINESATAWTALADGTAVSTTTTIVSTTIPQDGKYLISYVARTEANATGNAKYEMVLSVGGIAVDSNEQNLVADIMSNYVGSYVSSYLTQGTAVTLVGGRTFDTKSYALRGKPLARINMVKLT